MATFNLLGWLRKSPQPAAVVIDDKSRVEVPLGGRKWPEIAKTVQAMNPSTLKCLDGQGNVIRATTIDEDDDSKAAPSADMSDLQFFGRLLAEAHESGGKKAEPILKMAMDMIDRQGQRLAKQEQEIYRLRTLNNKLSAELALPPDIADDGGILGALAEGMAAAAAQQGSEKVTTLKKVSK